MINLIAAIVVAIAPVNSSDGSASTRVVSYADLDLTHDTGVTTLRHRIKGAVKIVCGDSDNRDLQAMRLVEKCRTNASAGAALQLAQAVEQAQQLASSKSTSAQIANR